MIEHADVVIIGAGAGGATVGGELAEAGAHVVFLEAGKDLDVTYGSSDHFASSQQFLDLVRDGLFWHEEYTGRRWHTDMGQCAGGGTTTYAGVLEESTPLDYALWPISYDELLPYIELTKKRYHVQRWPLEEISHYSQVVAEASDGVLGPIQSAFNREPYFEYGVFHDRCRRCRFCVLGCKFNAKANATTITLPKAKWFGAEVKENCWVTRLNTNGDGTRVESVTYLQRTPTGPGTEQVEEHTIWADRFILAAGAMMTPMLLHWSGPGDQTLANSSGQVGRNLRAHFLRAVFSILQRDDLRTYQGNMVELNDQYRNFDNGFLLEIHMISPPTYFGGLAEVLDTRTLVDMVGLPFKRFMRQFGRFMMTTPIVRSDDTGFTDNSILPHETMRNRYGDPMPTVYLEPTAQELEWLEAGVDYSRQILRNAEADMSQLLMGGIDTVHKVGTCRMGTDPTTSVTDLDGKCWDLDNLWIADGSLFPAPLLANCAFIIYSLAYKVADGILDRATPET